MRIESGLDKIRRSKTFSVRCCFPSSILDLPSESSLDAQDLWYVYLFVLSHPTVYYILHSLGPRYCFAKLLPSKVASIARLNLGCRNSFSYLPDGVLVSIVLVVL